MPNPEQLELLGDPGAPAIGKFQRPGAAAETQRLAAVEAYPAIGTWRRRVLAAIERTGDRGATDEELQDQLELNPSTQRPRRVELVERGFVTDSGRRRLTRSGRLAVVWVLTTWAGAIACVPDESAGLAEEVARGAEA